jgi:hypothetical protein
LIPLPEGVRIEDQLNFEDEERDYVAFVSGLEFGNPDNEFSISMLKQFLRGECGGEFEQKIAS